MLSAPIKITLIIPGFVVSSFLQAENIDSARDIQPIFAEQCTTCYGPDEQKGGLNLAEEESLHGKLKSGEPALVPSKMEESELLYRISTQGTDKLMPLPKHGSRLKLAAVALIRDLKERGLLDSTLVQWYSEFGRTPLGENRGGNENATGRDHRTFGFSMVMAGGGFKGGQVYGKPNEIGWSISENPVHPSDLQATILHCFGLNHKKLTNRFQGRDFRLTDVAGRVMKDWLA